jgi:RHS repeat-associated protein
MEMTAAAKAENSLLPKNRVWASNFVDYPFSSPSTSVTSTLRWGSDYRCDRTASDELDQRFYTSQFGRFMSADRFKGANPADSGSWNKYSYTESDPVNWIDPSGEMRCSPDEPCDDDGGVGWPGDPTPCTAVASASCQPGNGGAGEPQPKTPKLLHVTKIAKSGSNYDAVVKRLNQISAGIDPDCEKFLESGGNGSSSSYINGLLSASLLAVANFTSSIAAITGTGGTDVPAGTAAIIVNNNGAFFDGDYVVENGMYKGGTGQAQIAILLHELAHALGATGFQSDYNNPSAGKSNDMLINQNCGKTIQNLGSQ